MVDLSWWNSPEILGRWTDRLTGLTAVFGVLAAIAGFGAWKIGTRLGELKDREIGELRQRTEPRHLSNRVHLLQELPRVKFPAYMFVSGYDNETPEFAEEIRTLLNETGWKVSSSGGNFPTRPGVAVLLPPVSDPSFGSAEVVKRVFEQAGVVTYELATRPAEAHMPQMVILVGRRP